VEAKQTKGLLMDNNVSVNTKKRIDWLDIAKLLGIFCVIMAHQPINQDVIFIYNGFAIPLFFFLCGITTSNKSIKIDIEKSARTILVPYVCFFIISYLVWWFPIEFLRHPELWERSFKEIVLKPFLGLLVGFAGNTSYSTMVNSPLWFLPCLFWTKAVDSLISAIKNKTVRRIIIAFVFVLSVILFKIKLNLGPFVLLVQAILLYPILECGKIFKKYFLKYFMDENLSLKKRFIIFVELVISVALFCLRTYIEKRLNIVSIYMGLQGSWLQCLFGAVSGVWAIISLSRLIGHAPKVIMTLSQNTLIILGFHIIIYLYLIILLEKFFNINFRTYIPLGYSFILTTVVLFLCLIPINLIKRFCPWMIGSKKVK
jgi:acyltransferase